LFASGKRIIERTSGEPRILLYESEATRIAKYARLSTSLEIGGDLFGFYESNGNPLIFVASGPGPRADRDATHFQQDSRFQVEAFNRVASQFRLFYIGDWHSHHTLGLSEPSGSDDAKLRDLAEKNRWPVLYSLIVQTRRPEHSSHFRKPDADGPIESFGLWWNAFRYDFGASRNERARLHIEFQQGTNPYLALSGELNMECEAVCTRWSQEGMEFGRVGSYADEQQATRSETVGDELELGVFQQICEVITRKQRTAEMELQVDRNNRSRLIVMDGSKQIQCGITGDTDDMRLTISSAAGSHNYRLRYERGRVRSSDISTVANEIVTLLNPSAND
jgi:hypothetical protein